MARDRGIELELVPYANIPLAILNQESIERVIINLISNGIKYTPEGGKVSVILGVTDKEIAVHIKDTGIGIPEDSLEHIFDRFFRVEKKVHTIKGTGLGLTIVTKILEKHEGRITVSSSLGEGSTFSFFIPFYIDPAVKLARVGSDSENVKDSQAASSEVLG
jgi:signal transduction histidine kinase